MSIIKTLNKVERGFSWSFFGFVIAVIVACLSVYRAYYYKEKPIFDFQLLSSTEVLDIKEDIPSLDILFDSTSIKKTNQALTVALVKIQNTGNSSLTKHYYDDCTPVGLSISGGHIVSQPELVGYSESYLRENIKIFQLSSDSISFSKVILDKNAFFKIKLLILHPFGKDVKYAPFGKIAGMDSLVIKIIPDVEVKQPIITQVFSGGIVIILLRCILYSLVLILIGLIIVLPIGLIGGHIGERKRKRIVTKFKKVCEIELSDKDDRIFMTYIENGDELLPYMEKLVFAEDRLPRLISAFKECPELIYEYHPYHTEFDSIAIRRLYSFRALKRLLGARLVHYTKDESVEIDERGRQIFIQFVSYLRENKLLKAKILKAIKPDIE